MKNIYIKHTSKLGPVKYTTFSGPSYVGSGNSNKWTERKMIQEFYK